MRTELDRLLHRACDAAPRHSLVAAIGRPAFDDEVRRGLLVAVFPRIYARPWLADDPQVRQVAAIRHGGTASMLSHTTALHRYGLLPSDTGELHIVSDSTRHARGLPGRLVAHRTRLSLRPTLVTGLPTVELAVALLQAWPLLTDHRRRAGVIDAVRDRSLSTEALRSELARWPKTADRAELVTLLSLLDAGCESELELWGYRKVFNLPEFRHGRWQFPVTVAGRRYRVDLGFPEQRLAVELDGRAYHSSAAQWQRDIDRDLRLATAGWQTIRLSHQRLTEDVAGCRRDVARVLRARGAS